MMITVYRPRETQLRRGRYVDMAGAELGSIPMHVDLNFTNLDR